MQLESRYGPEEMETLTDTATYAFQVYMSEFV